MPLVFALLAPLLAAEPAAPVSACGGVTLGDGVEILGPGPGESDVPQNASIWAILRTSFDGTIELRLRDTADDTEVPTERLGVYDATITFDTTRFDVHAVRLRPLADLAPDHDYLIEGLAAGVSGGHAFRTGRTRDDEAPAVPVVSETAASAPGAACVSSFGLTVKHDGPSTLLYLAQIDGEPVALGRGSPIEVTLGRADEHAVGALFAMDLAGNRSASSARFEGDLPAAPQVLETPGVSSCATSATTDGVCALVIVAMVALRRARSACEAKSPRAQSAGSAQGSSPPRSRGWRSASRSWLASVASAPSTRWP